MAEPAGEPASRYLSPVRLQDVDDLNHAVSGSNLEVIQLKPGDLDVSLAQVSLGDLSIDIGTVNVPLRANGGLDHRRYSMSVFSPGARGTWNGRHVDPSKLLFVKPGQELNGYLAAAYGWTSFVVPCEWMDSVARTARHPNVLYMAAERGTLRPGLATLATLWQATARIIARAPTADDAASDDWLLADFRNALGATLSTCDTPPIKVMSRTLAHFSMARRAERYMRERITEPICIDDLCVAMHASRRYLEYAFTDAFGTSPSRYLRLLRLHEVRHRLRTMGTRTTVTDEALRLGFNHLSLFSTQYKKTFGESPSVTLAQATPPLVQRRLPAPPRASVEIADSRPRLR